nr:uncharacterized protein LOC111990334 [Quercus suber]POE79075.1 hypothetical protein CFP56_70868 [Quercus suber]
MVGVSLVRSREEDEELQRSTKKVKEGHRGKSVQDPHGLSTGGGSFSYKETLVGELPGAFEQAFDFNHEMDFDVISDDEYENLPPGEVAVKLSGERKNKIRASWSRGVVKVFGKSVGFHFLLSKLISMWKPSGKMDFIDLGYGFFLIKFSVNEDHARVFKGVPWFMGGHYLSIREWEPNFRPENANLSSVVVWVHLPGLPIGYYELSILKDIGKAIGPIFRIDTHTALETRGHFARLCVQVNFDEPIVKLIKVSGIDQPVQYEGINSLCFSCG